MGYFSELIIGADHAGFGLKETLKPWLISQGLSVADLGCFSADAVDYPAIAAKVAQQVIDSPSAGGILICGSGVGVSIAANRFNGIRAVLAHDLNTAQWSRMHNDANILCLGARVVAPELAQEIVDFWLNSEFEGERHQYRIDLMDQLVSSTTVEQQGASTPQCAI